MNEFLRESKSILSCAANKVIIVAGNESCDLDSMSAAILYAWFRQSQPARNAFSKTYVPLLNIPKDDLHLRPEFTAVFERCNIDSGNLVTLSDLAPPEKLPIEDTEWVLVDHNKLEGNLGSIYSNRVVGCIDHHDEENSVPKNENPEPRIIEKCGSCTSLVLRELATELTSQDPSLRDVPLYSTDALKLGISSILIDTNNLQDRNKTTKTDQDIVGSLDKALSIRDSDWNRDAFFGDIDRAKKSLGGLSWNDVLRKDYKQWTEGSMKLGISSVVRNIQFLTDLCQKNSTTSSDDGFWVPASAKFMQERNLDIWAIMTTYTEQSQDESQEFRRQLMIHWHNNQSERVVDEFCAKYSSELRLRPNGIQMLESEHASWKIWNQGNVAASRKQVGPMLRTSMKQNLKL